MKITIQFVIAIVFAVVAAGLNWFYLNMKTSPKTASFVVVADEIRMGERIDPKKLKEFKFVLLEGSESQFSNSSLVPFNKREVLFNMESPRTYKKGDFVLLQDLKKTGTPEYDSLGPFRLLSVGDQLTSQITDDRSSGRVVTLAVDKEYDEKTRKLIQILQRQKESDLENDPFQILGIEVLKRTTVPVESNQVRSLDLQDGEVAIFVDISNIDSVPSILSAGDQIRFTIPKISNLVNE